MSTNIIDAVTDKLGVHHIQKIDPNTQEVMHPEKGSSDEFFYQAAIPAVLTAIYRFTRVKDGNTELLFTDTSGKPLALIFGENKQMAIDKIVSYTGVTAEYAEARIRDIALACRDILKQQFPGKVSDADVRGYFTDQRNIILKSLPAGLKMGDIFNDDTVDDRTHKMEGPISDYLHWIEKFFSGVDRKKTENW